MRTILHVDMDAFYASVEALDDPSLRGKPVIVGGRSRRGVVLAASYEVRAFGVRSAMSMVEALRRAPHAVVVAPRPDRYAELSDRAFSIFRRYTPLVEPLSLDEAFLDVTASRELFGDGQTIASAIRREIRGELGLTASAGVAPCKFAAKVASDVGKPDGLVVVPPDGVASFLAPLPIERMWGVGPKTAPRMRALGYLTLGDLARVPPDSVAAPFGAWGARAARLARGDDERTVEAWGQSQSISAEATYDDDLEGAQAVRRTLLSHATRVARRLLSAGLCARTVTLKVKYADFAVRTRRMTLPEPVQDTDSIYRAAISLLDLVPLQARRVRLTGVGVSGLEDGPPPRLVVPDPIAEKRRRLEEVSVRIADRFHDHRLVTRASLIDDDAGDPRGSSAASPGSRGPREPGRSRRPQGG